MNSVWFMLLVQLILIGLNAVFAAAEIAMLSVNEAKLSRLKEHGDRRAKRLSAVTAKPEKFLATIQVAITLSGFLGSAFAADNFSDSIVELLLSCGVPLPRQTLDTLAVVLITLTLSYFTLVFGELVPKRIAMKRSEQLALAVSGAIRFISIAFSPVVWLLSASTNGVLRLLRIDPHEAAEPVTEEEIRMMVDAGSAVGTIDHEEKMFIENVFRFDDLTAGEISTHRTKTVVLRLESTMQQWAEIIHSTRHSLYPVCESTVDSVVGILHTKDYFRLADKSRESVMQNAVSPPHFVPEGAKADMLFKTMKTGGISMSVVIDENGGMAGIINQKDLIERLVGRYCEELDEISRLKPQIIPNTDGSWRISGNIGLEELERTTGIPLHCTEYDTLSGLVFNTLGVIPEDGAHELELSLPKILVRVKKIEHHLITEAEVLKS